ncbi:MAG: hypothetical protein KatS3mg091_280 [Patescibacteria group bacterium]|nr:MAG: hypothetical protein KatS3mg091_280 [Patescibacteria group bacterium]
MKIVYFGSPDFSAELLESLVGSYDILAVATQSRKPVGRGLRPKPTAVGKTAQKNKIVVFEVLNKSDLLLNKIKSILKQADFALVYAFGLIIPEEVLSLPRYGFFNVHPSLLPKFRGPSPVVYPLALGEDQTGVSIIKMDKYMDHGPLIFQEKIKISKNDFASDVLARLNKITERFFSDLLHKNLNDLKFFEQNHSLATYTRLLSRSDGYVPLSHLEALHKSRDQNKPLSFLPNFLQEYLLKYQENLGRYYGLYSLFRALHPWPGLFTFVGKEKKRLKILDVSKDNKITKVQLEGKPAATIHNFLQYLKNFY